MKTPSTEMQDALSDRVVKLAAKQVALSTEQISRDARFVDDLGFDSLDVVEFMMEVEDEFDVSVPDDVAQKILTVRQAVDAIRRLVEAQDRAK
jgi:acyl carrier protein